MSPEVTAWMDAARAGDREAFGRLYVHYYRAVFGYVVARVGRVHVAEELAAEVFTRALAGIGTFTWSGREPGAWLITIARNVLIDRARRPAYRLEALTADFANAEVEGRLVVEDAAEEIDRHARRAAVREAIGRLQGDAQRRAMWLRHVEGLSDKETAAAVGRGLNPTKALCYRARRHLRCDADLLRVVA